MNSLADVPEPPFHEPDWWSEPDPSLGYARRPPWARDDDRLRHLVFVDGRLVDAWTDSVAGTRWAADALRFDEERRPPRPPDPPPRPEHEQVLGWLDSLVGRREALLALTDDPTPEPHRVPLPPDGDPVDEAARIHLDSVASRFLDHETGRILEDALGILWERDPAATLRRAPEQTAAGLCWVVGKANGLFGSGLRQQDVQEHLGLRSGLSSPGQAVARTLRGAWFGHDRAPWQMSRSLPGIEAFGDVRLLTSATRRLLIPWRDAALEAAREAGADAGGEAPEGHGTAQSPPCPPCPPCPP